MARRRHQEEHENHERWLVSYADFITLLFAFFVVMYSISSINEGKYKVLSDSLTGVFNQPDRAIKPIPIGEERPRTTMPEASQVEESPPSEAPVDPLEDIAFQADGHFVEAPTDWGNPEQQASSQQFFVILEACASKLPASQGRLFLMREWLELSSEEICKELQLTPTNLYVQLHRARLRLRECLELNWFMKASA